MGDDNLMWREAVKAKLLHETARWQGQHAADFDDGVKILSVTQFISLLHGGASRRELHERFGIFSHDISTKARGEDHHASPSVKRARTENADHHKIAEVAFTSQRVWLTGFLRHQPARSNKPSIGNLCLCDATNKLPVRLLYPRLELLDALVLIQHWTVVHNGAWDPFTPNGSMEVHKDPVILHSPMPPPLSLEDAREAIRIHYPTSDPPMYIGTKHWEENVNKTVKTDDKPSKRKVYVVFGHVTSVSSVAMQEDPSMSHFFVEVESVERQEGTKSLVNVLLAGTAATKWHPFLWPGLLVVLTDLKKVYYKESEMFLLQATAAAKESTAASTNLIVWRSPTEYGSSVFRPISPQACVSENPSTRPGETMVDIQGVVASIIWDECLVLEGDPSVVVALFHYPWPDIKAHIRVGSHVHVYHAHVLHRPRPSSSRFIVGLCLRSHLRLSCHALANGQALGRQHVSRSRRLHKKWSSFGDLSRQPLSISMWWLNLLAVSVQKFRFGTDTDPEAMDACSFPCVRRREATLMIGQDALCASSSQSVAAPSTLARRFLNSHTQGSHDCSSVSHSGDDTYLDNTVVTIHDLRQFIEDQFHKKIAEAEAASERIDWPVHIPCDALTTLPAIGILRGCVGSSDLEMADQTGSIPLVLNQVLDCSGDGSVQLDRGCAVYALKKYAAIVEQVRPVGSGMPGFVVSLTGSITDLQRVSLCPSSHPADQSGCTERSTLLVFVTCISSWKRRRHVRAVVDGFRHIRGIGFCQNANVSSGSFQPDWFTAHNVELVVSVDCESWFLQQFNWYTVIDATKHTWTQQQTNESRLVHWLQLVLKTSETTQEQTNAWWSLTDQEPEPQPTGTYVVDRGSYICPVSWQSPITRTATGSPPPFARGLSLPIEEPMDVIFTSLECLARRMNKHIRIRDLFVLGRQGDGGESTPFSMEKDPHTSRLINLVGVVTERELYFKDQPNDAMATRRPPVSDPDYSRQEPQKIRMCRLKLRNLHSLEAVTITVDEEAFGTLSALQPRVAVELSMVQCFIARSSFKPFLTWTHCTTVRRLVSDSPCGVVPTEAQLFARLPTTYLSELYKSSGKDRTIKRLTVRVVHMSYAVVKRRCSLCKQPLSLVKRQRTWVHTADLADDINTGISSTTTNTAKTTNRARKCSWKQLAQDAPFFEQQTYLSCSMRSIIDDGSAQGELFLENEMVWELLRCSHGQRRRFEELLLKQTSELSYYATKLPTESLFTTPLAQENIYYQNEWRAFVQTTIAALGSIAVCAQRFYQQGKDAPHTAVLTFGKDIQITTTSVPLVQLEALRVDELNARHELRRRLAGRAAELATQ